MSHLRAAELTVCTFFTSVVVSAVCMAAQPPAVQDEKPGPSAVPTQSQVTDDTTPELKDPVEEQDPKKIEARAAFMEGLAAQKDGNLNDAIKAFTRAAAADPTAPEPVRAHALLLRRLNRIRQAEQMARKAIELDPDDYQMRLELAGMLLAQQGATEAASLVDSALESKRLDHKSAEFINLHSVRGKIYLLTGDAAKAGESFGVILEALLKPEEFGLDFRQHKALMADRTTGFKSVGQIMLKIGNYDKAMTAFAALIEANDDAPSEEHYWLALAQYRKDDLEDAEKNLNRYFESRRRSRPALQLLSDIYHAKTQSAQIVKRLQDLARDSSDTDAVNMFLGDMLVEGGKGDEAAAVYQDVIANSGNADAYVGLIRVDVLNHDAESLMSSVTKALKARIHLDELNSLIEIIVNSEDFAKSLVQSAVESLADESKKQRPEATYFYSQIADRLDLVEPEGKLLEATLAQNPGQALTVEAVGRLGLNQYMRDDYTAAADTFKKLLSIPGLPAGETVMTLYRLSAAEAENGNFETAIRAIQTALKHAPQNPQLTYQLGLIELQSAAFDDAERTLKSAIKLSEADPKLEAQSRMLLGGLYTQQRRWTDAIEAYEDLLKMPELPPVTARRGRTALSNAHVQNGDLENGQKILEEVYKLEPDDPGVNNDLGYLYAEQDKNLEKAEKMIRIAVASDPDNAAYLDSLGWVLYRLGKFDEAAKALEKANNDPETRDATIIEHLGDVMKKLDRADEAAKAWREALNVENKSTSPNDETVERLTKKLKPSAEPATTE